MQVEREGMVAREQIFFHEELDDVYFMRRSSGISG